MNYSLYEHTNIIQIDSYNADALACVVRIYIEHRDDFTR